MAIGSLLITLGLAAWGCADGRPRPGSLDVAASRKASAARAGNRLIGFGPRTLDVSPKAKAGARIKAARPVKPGVRIVSQKS